MNCARCGTWSCSSSDGRHPADCPTAHPTPAQAQALREAKAAYDDPAVRRLAQVAAWVEKAGYCQWTRLEETIELARHMGWSHLGIACCVGLRREAAAIARIFEDCGFVVSVVVCKAGEVPKDDIGVPADAQFEAGESMCNSVGQAALLAAQGCEFNVVVGLCVGHDTLFLGESFRRGVPSSVLIAKDRVTGHNPAAAVYCAPSYFAARIASHRPAPDAGNQDPDQGA
jgi:uncharacterized metal-binding protein